MRSLPPHTLARATRSALPVLVVLTALVAGAAGAQDAPKWPCPPSGWWATLKGGERATYDLRQGDHAGRRVLHLDRVEGAKLTISMDDRSPDGAASVGSRVATVDASDAEEQGDLCLPPGATLRQVGHEALEVGGRALACDVYEVTIEGPRGKVTMKTWYCPQLPPVFMGGTVKLVSEVGGERATITLLEYQGALLPAPPR